MIGRERNAVAGMFLVLALVFFILGLLFDAKILTYVYGDIISGVGILACLIISLVSSTRVREAAFEEVDFDDQLEPEERHRFPAGNYKAIEPPRDAMEFRVLLRGGEPSWITTKSRL